MASSKITPKLNLPTILTLSRIVVIPFFIWITPGYNFLGAVIFSLASITDFLDGYLARKQKTVTMFGTIIDPIADKFLVIAALVLLLDMGRISIWIAVIIIVREFLVTALRAVALSMNIVIKAEMGGKLKVGAQITGILCLLLGWNKLDVYFMDKLVEILNFVLGVDVADIGIVALWISIVLGVISGIQYMTNFFKTVTTKNAE